MNTYVPKKRSFITLSVLAAMSLTSMHALAQEAEAKAAEEDKDVESILVTGRNVSYANSATSTEMKKQQTPMTSALALIDNLPGVLVTEGDPFGSDEWSTTISIRGFQVNLDSQQIGMTVDGIANGNSNYGGGTKASRYIDTENLRGTVVSQGTADISSRSNEALGGTMDFTTIRPALDEQLTVSTTFAEYNASKIYVRYDTGEIAPDTFAWLSLSTQQNDDYMDGSVTNTRDHLEGKIISTVGEVDLTGYVSYDDAQEFTYQRVYGLAQYAQNPDWDGLTESWSGIPYQDQVYRGGWVTERENFFTYLKADFSVGSVDFSTNVYYHENEGTGKWNPYYIADVTDDGAGNANSELDSSTTAFGGASQGLIYFVNSAGEALSPIDGCVSSISSPYGGGGAEVDPNCYEQGAIAVSSNRHTHYNKKRIGINGDFVWNTTIADMDNVVRGGFWYEDYQRDEYRDWHKTIDASTSARYENTPYWVQYDREFPVETLMYYVENELDAGFAKIRLGAKQFNVDVSKEDQFTPENNLDISSDSDVLISAGFVAPLPVNGLELFGGYAENFAAVKDAVLERDDTDISTVEPETADNIDFGLRYSTPGFNASLTYYTIEFENRITFVSNEDVNGIDFLESAAGGYINDGGIESDGIEASIDYSITDSLGIYVSYTKNDSTYTDEGVSGNTVIGSPEDMAVVSFDYTKGDFYAGFSTKYVGERFLDQANTQETDSYIVSDLYLGKTAYDIGGGIDSVELSFTVNNVFDEDYLGSIAANAGWIGAPRIASFNVRVAM
ncbi:TonB-dependent receptor [Alteromonas stellipolaris]|jgi:iron complex outermembrane receptor protein|uniref:TonB-dependent receptor n=1 Tax=Alteromonas stellipolaris TaxID=233316 RepID=A0AAW7Z148_9ALTE|nr:MULTISPECIES: TonB-dependent receptor [Alteromonas]AMJ90898.1 TonB-dependent receptor [Alteromonas sp. Mac2]AMJ87037.1 TonB-dependent receptor [Alteromonas sp. Mac1]ANB23852.1 TonB-dependent receptor [Alteromonas stellipolaris]MDO6539549.1 TonB-dependent receptor [Alteromonas stellipolaris]MDO6576203.1 TonB-dependent receptor [Alteromonas stellipolaris]